MRHCLGLLHGWHRHFFVRMFSPRRRLTPLRSRHRQNDDLTRFRDEKDVMTREPGLERSMAGIDRREIDWRVIFSGES